MSKTQELREAYIAGALAMAGRRFGPLSTIWWQRRAQDVFPTPTITRPRVITMPGEMGEYRFVNGVFEFRYDSSDKWGDTWFTPARVGALAELMAAPTETVEVDDA